MTDNLTILVVEPLKTPRTMTIPDTLEALQDIVGGWIQAISLDETTVLYCNEEGKLKGLTPNRALRVEPDGTIGTGPIADIICGTFAICGTDPDTGATISLTDEQTAHWASVYEHPEIMYRTPVGRTGMIPVHSG